MTMTRIKNDRLLRAINHQEVDRTPIWLMRQAGRYLPEYGATRKKAGDFLALCKNPELACEVTLQPLARFDFDAAILFSDILTIPDAMGLGLFFAEGEGPMFETPIRTHRDIEQLGIPDPETELKYVIDAVRLIKKELDGSVPLIGFAGSPWTIASYMVEGGPSKTFSLIKTLLYQEPHALHHLLKKLSQAITLYLNAQIKAGVNVVMLFDTWGGILTPADYKNFSLHYMTEIINNLNPGPAGIHIPTILFTKNGGQWLEIMAASGCNALGLDWTIDIAEARKRVGDKVALQGNLDPAVLYADPAQIYAKVKEILAGYGKGSGHIFNLGHGINPDTPPENVTALVDAVQELSRFYHNSGTGYDQKK